ncbi:putative rna-binding protein rnp24-like protein [Diaporthe ampelina]|uniref:Putative rna-binding protein rnp24-like protein n=1 Tax=Diaporthe ampelina TaxID=1214573 RepID=A0A0G2FTG0_9PEZI|nr:putative rna-binding protein rnp24-like protein [Diaporthe ampelina]
MSTETETPPRASPEAVSETSKKSKKRKNDAEEIEVDLSLPEPPSKKAKRLLKKGKPLPVKKESDDEASDKEGGSGVKKDKDKKKERSPYGVWIGNLRFSVTKHDLRDWLLENSGGSITADHITRIKLPSSRPKGSRRAEGGAGAGEPFENKGYAYVDFSTYDATIAAIALSETEWHRRKLLIKDAKSFEGRPAKPKPDADGNDAGAGAATADASAEPKSTTKKIFVGNLSFQTTEDDLHELFGTCGEIEWLKVAQFEDSGKCKGYAWVKFKEAEAADWAVKGFVKIKEVEETEEDFMDVDEKEEEQGSDREAGEQGAEDDGDSDEKQKKTAKKAKSQNEERRVKTRKWWVNTLHGRRLKIEAAEDDQTRYKKRYGGKSASAGAGGQKENSTMREGGGDRQRPQPSTHRHNNNKKRRDHDEGGSKDTGANTAAPKEAEVSNFRQDISVARLTGAPVKPQGKKTTFD